MINEGQKINKEMKFGTLRVHIYTHMYLVWFQCHQKSCVHILLHMILHKITKTTTTALLHCKYLLRDYYDTPIWTTVTQCEHMRHNIWDLGMNSPSI